MALRKHVRPGDMASGSMKPLSFTRRVPESAQLAESESRNNIEPDVDIDLREVYFLIMHFLSSGPCHRTYGQFWNELLEHQLLPRRYHSWYSRNGAPSGDDNDDGMSFPLNYSNLVDRYPHIGKDHLVKLLKQLLINKASPSKSIGCGNTPNAADVPSLIGTGPFSLLSYDKNISQNEVKRPPIRMRWPHIHTDQVRGLRLREIGGGFARHHRAPSIRAACYAIAKPSTMVQKMQNIKRIRGHRNAVYCAMFDRSGRYVITGSDDRLVKIWSMETAYCLASCRGHEGDITDLAVNSNNIFVASSSNDCVIRVWRLPDGLPVSVLRGHTGAVTAIAFSPRLSSPYQLLSSSDDGTCRIWDARSSQFSPRIYVPRPPETVSGKNNGPSSTNGQQRHQIFCCTFNANGTVFVTGSSDTLARVWNACKSSTDDPDQPHHEIDVLSGHENDVNYVQFSGCAVASRFSIVDFPKEENFSKFKNSWFSHDNIVTCSRDGSAIIWVPRSRRSHGKHCRWIRAYHLKVPPPPMPPQPPRGGPRQRILPTPRGVNMIAWSLDNRFVLAAIMDCRICVWNATDGSLVHCLTGHTQSTYVMDVHPFNPRIAMSAGYDGQTIVWDIWEGTPIQIYEISHFKLVDGKFSPDGTSIILSDDVGQLYILNTGQGESQKDAKYDQFYLGDYRPLIQDTYGNVLDQETQLPPFRRNMEDPLCDSGMIPYPEPYQIMFQQRRLGALGKEWRPSSLKLAVGPDITLDQDYQMLPLADLDIMIEPLPEFVDVMDWEPENEVQSDDADSEYNANDEYDTGGEQGGLSSLSSGDEECSSEDSEVEGTSKDALRRSRRKKQKAETEIMTSSGRRVKRRNFDECEGTLMIGNRSRKSRLGRKVSRRRFSTSKSSRPQRAAARNALNFFSKITCTSTDSEDEEGSIGQSSESGSLMEDSNIESDDSGSIRDNQSKQLKGKEIYVDDADEEAKSHELPESHNAGNRKRLVLKLPGRDSNKLVLPKSKIPICDNQEDVVGSSSNTHLKSIRTGKVSTDKEYSSGSPNCKVIDGEGRRQLEKYESQLDLSKTYSNLEVRWGVVKARTSKRIRLGEATSPVAYMSADVDLDHKEDENLSGDIKPENHRSTGSPCLEPQTDGNGETGDVTLGHEKTLEADTSLVMIGGPTDEGQPPNEYRSVNKSPNGRNVSTDNSTGASVHFQNGTDHPLELKDSFPPLSTMLRPRSKRITKDSEFLKLKQKELEEDRGSVGFDALDDCDIKLSSALEVSKCGGSSRIDPAHGGDDLQVSNDYQNKVSDSTSHNPLGSHLQSKKMYDVVYKRSKLHRNKTNSGGNVDGSGETNINTCDQSLSAGTSVQEGTSNAATEPNVVNTISRGLNLRSEKAQELDEPLINTQNGSTNMLRCQTLQEEWASSSRTTVGCRSTRNRRTNFMFRDSSPVDRRSDQSPGKGSWLMLSTHEEGSRYIPQKGDEIVYLRQGHQEYINYNNLKEVGPWVSIKGNIRAVEFCRVENLEYSTLPGSGDSCCKMTLKFVDPSSSVFHKLFKLTMPEVTSFPDFLVERTRYDTAMHRNWTCRDKCRVWWKNEGEEDGSWWDGRILSVRPKSSEFPDSPWEKYTIRYKSDPTETHLHSPWELFDVDSRWEQPHIDDGRKLKLLSAFAKLEKSSSKVQDPYGVQKLKQVSSKSSFSNRFPVPLSLELIQSRLENNYYRSLEALRHDTSVMLSNAESYFGKNAELTTKIVRLSDWFSRTFSSL